MFLETNLQLSLRTFLTAAVQKPIHKNLIYELLIMSELNKAQEWFPVLIKASGKGAISTTAGRSSRTKQQDAAWPVVDINFNPLRMETSGFSEVCDQNLPVRPVERLCAAGVDGNSLKSPLQVETPPQDTTKTLLLSSQHRAAAVRATSGLGVCPSK